MQNSKEHCSFSFQQRMRSKKMIGILSEFRALVREEESALKRSQKIPEDKKERKLPSNADFSLYKKKWRKLQIRPLQKPHRRTETLYRISPSAFSIPAESGWGWRRIHAENPPHRF